MMEIMRDVIAQTSRRLTLRVLGEFPAEPLKRQDDVIEQFKADLRALRLPDVPSGRLRVSLRRRSELRKVRQLISFMVRRYLLAFIVIISVIGVPLKLLNVKPSEGREGVGGGPGAYRLTERGEEVINVVSVVGLWVIVIPMLLLILAFALRSLFRELGNLRVTLRYTLVMQIAATISACARAHRAGGERVTGEMRSVSKKLARVLRGIERAHRTRRMIPRHSHRRKALKAHERLVVGALRRSEAALDTRSRDGLADLSALLITIAERYTEGRVGALLDDGNLEGVTPEPSRELLRWLTSLALSVFAITTITLLDLPTGVESPIITGAGLLVVGLLYGPSARRAADILELGRGGTQ